MELKNRVAIITGARRGIGRAIAETYAKSGANLTLVDIDSSELEKVADEVSRIGQTALPFKADITNKEELKRMVAATLQQFGKVDVLVNNAGIAVMKPFLEQFSCFWADEYQPALASLGRGGIVQTMKENSEVHNPRRSQTPCYICLARNVVPVIIHEPDRFIGKD